MQLFIYTVNNVMGLQHKVAAFCNFQCCILQINSTSKLSHPFLSLVILPTPPPPQMVYLEEIATKAIL